MIKSVGSNTFQSNRTNFRGYDPSSPNYQAMMASYTLPGAGQLMNGDKRRGYMHLAIWTALTASIVGVFFKNIDAMVKKDGKVREFKEFAKSFTNKEGLKENYKNFIKDMTASKKITGVAIIAGIYINSITSAMDAYKGPKENQDK